MRVVSVCLLFHHRTLCVTLTQFQLGKIDYKMGRSLLTHFHVAHRHPITTLIELVCVAPLNVSGELIGQHTN